MYRRKEQTEQKKKQILEVPPTLITDLYKTKPATKEKIKDNIVNSLDYRTDIKHFTFHQCYIPGTWILDKVFYDENCFLFCHEGNSRYLEVYSKTEQWQEYTKASGKLEAYNNFDLNELLVMFCENNMKETTKNKRIREIKLIIWDDASTHESAKNFCLDDFSIVTIKINVSQMGHSPMRILDRVVRTIRDLKNSFEVKLEKEYPKLIQGNNYKISGLISILASYYNKSPHKTLEEMTGIKRMTPWNVHINEIIEWQIITYCQAWNYKIMNLPNYKLEICDKVLVKNVENRLGHKKRTKYLNNNQEFTIIAIKDNNLFELSPFNIIVPRSRLVKIKDND